jgi:hypothetical protein
MIKESDRLIISTEVGGASELQSFRAIIPKEGQEEGK